MRILKILLKEADGSLEMIFSKAFSKKNRKFEIEDAVILGFFEDMVRKIDSLISLLDAEKLVSIDLITRSIFESYVYLKLLLLKDRRLYAKSYIASQKMKEFSMFNSLIAENKDGVKIRKLLGKRIEEIKRDIKFEAEEKLNKVQLQFSDVFEKRGKNQNWYNLDSKTKNFEQLCRKLDLFAEYELVYRILSSEVHSMDVMKRWRFEPNQVYVLEGFTNSEMNISTVKKFLLEAINDLYTFYGLMKELKDFNVLLSLNYRLSKSK